MLRTVKRYDLNVMTRHLHGGSPQDGLQRSAIVAITLTQLSGFAIGVCDAYFLDSLTRLASVQIWLAYKLMGVVPTFVPPDIALAVQLS